MQPFEHCQTHMSMGLRFDRKSAEKLASAQPVCRNSITAGYDFATAMLHEKLRVANN